MKNNARIEWAGTGITTSAKSTFSWPNQENYWGGLIYAENSEFVNNKRAIEFMQYPRPSEDLSFSNKSQFYNVRFMEEENTNNPNDPIDVFEGTVGVTIWDTDNIIFENCQFENFDHEGILLYDAGARITTANQFISNDRGISSLATYPFGAPLEIGIFDATPNLFIGNDVHVDISANIKLGGIKIVNNEFFEGRIGVWLEGPNNYTIKNNAFDGMEGAVVGFLTGVQNAFQSNYINCNTIRTSNYGIGFFGENRQVQFLSNNFITPNIDAYLFGIQSFPGRIRAYQGNLSLPADNCFTFPQQGTDMSTIGTTSSFRYYINSGTSELCKTPTTLGNYTVHNTIGTKPTDCDSEDIKEDTPTKTKLLQERNIRLAIEQIEGWATDPVLQEEWLASRDRQEHYLKGVLQSLKTQGDWDEIETILLGENSEKAKMVLYAIHANNGEYSKAEQQLSTISNDDGLIEGFKAFQQLNLNRLEQGTSFELNENQENNLKELAYSDSPLRGLAQNMLTLTKGIRFDREIPDLSTTQALQITPPASNTISINVQPKVYPNPAEETINVDLQGVDFETGKIEVVNMLGQIVISQNFDAEILITLDMSKFKAGLYQMQIQLDGVVQFPLKVIIE